MKIVIINIKIAVSWYISNTLLFNTIIEIYSWENFTRLTEEQNSYSQWWLEKNATSVFFLFFSFSRRLCNSLCIGSGFFIVPLYISTIAQRVFQSGKALVASIAYLCLLSALQGKEISCILVHLMQIILPLLLYEHKGQSLIKGMYMIFFSFTSWIFSNSRCPFSKSPEKPMGPEKPYIKLQPAHSIKLVFWEVVKGIKIKITANFHASRLLSFEDTRRMLSPDMHPKSFGIFVRRGPDHFRWTISDARDGKFHYYHPHYCFWTRHKWICSFLKAMSTRMDQWGTTSIGVKLG